MENNIVVAPYNFVRFSEQVLRRYSHVSELPRHDTIEPTLLSGEIRVTMTAETPVLVGGSSTDKVGDDARDKYFYRTPDGCYAIPGSTMKGLVRENMQILGFGAERVQEDLDERRLMFRDFASKGSELKDHYTRLLDIKTEKIGTNPITSKPIMTSNPRRAEAGYLVYQGRDDQGRDHYSIYPVLENGGKCYILSRTSGGVAALPELKKLALRPRGGKSQGRPISKAEQEENERINSERSLLLQPVAYTVASGKVMNLKFVSSQGEAPEGMKPGVLLVTGLPVGKDNAVYLFPHFTGAGKEIPLQEKDVVAYKDDLKERKIGMPKDLKGRPKTLWDLPERVGEWKPVFFLRDGGNRIYFGMSRFLRVGYPHTTAEGLPPVHREIAKQESQGDRVLDYPSAILGFATDRQAYRSRVSFEDLSLCGKENVLDLPAVVLAEPKPSFYRGYLENGKNPEWEAYYIDPDFRLRGFKQYWHQKQSEVKASDKPSSSVKLHMLDRDSAFSGAIHFRNLHKDELGLLLWSLLADGPYRHSVGAARPYGYGRMRLSIDSLRLYDSVELYEADGLLSRGKEKKAEVEDYILAYKEFAKNLADRQQLRGALLDASDTIRDFLFMKSKITENPDEVRYMDLDNKEYQGNTGILPPVEYYRANPYLLEPQEGDT